mmetsp:Transcript_27811/g.42817  ORF Transcript_27811/g.42817 Transcript_27811/m.42817 type:complete len:219 (-) Transcript_27811:30-686(-)
MFQLLPRRTAESCSRQWLPLRVRMGQRSSTKFLPRHSPLLVPTFAQHLPSTFRQMECRAFSSRSVDDEKTENSVKHMVVTKWGKSQKYWMSNTEYAGVVVGKESTGGDYVISDGIMAPGGFVPNHFHKWEDQTFHVITGELEAKIGNETFFLSPGDSIHCPRGVSHYMKNVGSTEAKLISYIFPGHWAEDFMAETSRQNHEGKQDLKLIEQEFGVVYL